MLKQFFAVYADYSVKDLGTVEITACDDFADLFARNPGCFLVEVPDGPNFIFRLYAERESMMGHPVVVCRPENANYIFQDWRGRFFSLSDDRVVLSAWTAGLWSLIQTIEAAEKHIIRHGVLYPFSIRRWIQGCLLR